MKHMKNLVCILLCLFVLTSCSTPKEENTYLKNIREQVQGADKLLGVAYLGDVEGDFQTIGEYLDSQEYIKVYPFIKEIKESHFIENEGAELYCVLPADNNVSVTIYETVLNQETAQPEQGEQLFLKKDGKPILLRGNISDIVPNLMIVAKKDDSEVSFSPSLSLKNGMMDNSRQEIFEFTPYELMPQFNGTDASVQWEFCGDWTATVTEFNGETYQLNFSAASDSCVELSYESETVTGSYTGNWLILSDQRLRLELGGEAKDSKMPDALGLHTDVDGIYYWDMQDGNLILTYINGTPFYPVATVKEFRFVPVN